MKSEAVDFWYSRRRRIFSESESNRTTISFCSARGGSGILEIKKRRQALFD